MPWLSALLVAAALVAVTTLAGVWLLGRSGRVRDRRGETTDAAALRLSPADLGAAATLVQFSTQLCSRCPGTAKQLVSVADSYEGVHHIEIDLTHDAELADRFHVRQTPTTMVLDGQGRSVARIAGVPRLTELRALLDGLAPDPIATGR